MTTNTEQALREALQAVIAAHEAGMQELGERMRAANQKTLTVQGQAAIAAFDAIEQARQALALPTASPVDEQGLPPLPEPTYIYHDAPQGEDALFVFEYSGAVDEGCPKCKRLYTADQMRDYARAALQSSTYVRDAVLAEREACAKVCERIDLEYEGDDVQATWCAAAIRARSETSTGAA